MKGADVVMAGIVQYNDWLEEEVIARFFKQISTCKIILDWRNAKKLHDLNVGNLFFFPLYQCGNMAREGLRVLVVAKKSLTEEQYQDFEVSFQCLVIRKSAME